MEHNAFIVAFGSATAAMQLASIAEEEKIDGRIIPLPRSMSAGCGMAWLSPASEENSILKILTSKKIPFESALKTDYRTRCTHEKRDRKGN